MKGENIHIFEELTLSGGSLDGKFIPHDGFVTVRDAKWKTISSVCGIYFVRYHH